MLSQKRVLQHLPLPRRGCPTSVAASDPRGSTRRTRRSRISGSRRENNWTMSGTRTARSAPSTHPHLQTNSRGSTASMLIASSKSISKWSFISRCTRLRRPPINPYCSLPSRRLSTEGRKRSKRRRGLGRLMDSESTRLRCPRCSKGMGHKCEARIP